MLCKLLLLRATWVTPLLSSISCCGDEVGLKTHKVETCSVLTVRLG